MQLNYLITKILPESLAFDSSIILHDNAVHKLYSGKDKKLILLKAAKGFGKTGVLSLFVNKYNLKYSYYKLDEEDDNLFVFLNYLINSLDKSLPGFITEMLVLLNFYKNSFIKKDAKNKNDITNYVKALINHLYQFTKDDFYIVIDDTENISDYNWAQLFFDFFIKNSPKNIHFVFITTQNFPFDYNKFKITRNFTELNNDDLRVDSNLVKKIAADIYNLNLTNDRALYIIDRTEGWITGVHIFLQSIAKHLDTPENINLSESMEYFFECEVLENLDSKYQKVLIISALFDNFTEKLLTHLFKGVNIDFLIEVIRNKYGFAIKNNSDGSYQYLTFFKDFLLKKSVEMFDKKLLRKLYYSASVYYKKLNNVEEYVKYLLKSEDYKKAIPIIEKKLVLLSQSTDYGVIDKWLNKIPDAIYEEYPFLYFYKGLLNRTFYSDFAAAENYFDKCLKNKDKIIEEYFIKSLCYKADILTINGKVNAALSLLSSFKLNNILKKNQRYVQHQLVLINYHLGNLDNSIKISNEILNSVSKKKDFDSNKIKYFILNMLGNIYAMRGEYKNASHYFQLCINNSELNLHKVLCLVNYYLVSICQGNFEVLESINSEIQRYKFISELPEIKKLTNEMELLRNFETGLEFETLKKAEEILKLARETNSPKLAQNAIITKCKIYFYSGDYGLLKKYSNEALKSEKALSEIDRMKIEVFQHTLKNNLKQLKEILFVLEKSSSFEDLIFCLFRTVEICLTINKMKEAGENLQRVFLLSDEMQYYNCAVKEYLFKREIFDFAIQNKIEIKFIQNLQSEISRRKRYINKFEIFYDIKIVFFGIPQIYIRGLLIEDSLWKRKKFKLMFLYLILNKDTYITKDILIDEFFSEADREYSDNIFHQFLSNMRSLLKIEGAKFSPEFILYKNKYFEVNSDYILESDYEDFTKNFKKINLIKNTIEEKQSIKSLIELSSEEFMKGYYESWIEDLREEVSTKRIRLIKILADRIVTEGNLYERLELYELLSKNDSIDFEELLELIKLHIDSGENQKAKKRYNEMTVKFKEELLINVDNNVLNFIKKKISV